MKRTKQVAAVLGVLAAATVGTVGEVMASSTTDRPASIQVWPKIVVDTSGAFTGGVATDTQITLTNTFRGGLKQAHCFYVNATSHCSNIPSRACQTPEQCCDTLPCVTGAFRGTCDPSWNEIDFDIYLTQEQPLQWYASEGLQRGDFPVEGPFFCNAPLDHVQCFNDIVCAGFGCNTGQSNLGSGIPPVGEDPFIGSLTCIQFTGANPSIPDHSTTRDNLIGHAAIARGGLIGGGTVPTAVDVAKYNSVGISAEATSTSNTTLLLNSAVGDYQPCPSTLILSHIFDGATDPLGTAVNQTYSTELTLVPCSNDFARQVPGRTTAQFLVFNEFEQRFSTSRTIDCLFDGLISTIDTRNPARSIFSAGVAGTIAGQTRIRGVGGNTIGGIDTSGGLLGVARALIANKPGPSSAAYQLHQQGNAVVDVIILP
jgi:hypothetical protein